MKKYLIVLSLFSFLCLHGEKAHALEWEREEEPSKEKQLEEEKDSAKIVKKEIWTCPFCGKKFSKPVSHQCVPVSLTGEKFQYNLCG